MQIINFSVNLNKIDKSKIVEGKKGKYLPLTVFVQDEKDKYDNNVAVIQSQTEEERKNKRPRTMSQMERSYFSQKQMHNNKPNLNNKTKIMMISLFSRPCTPCIRSGCKPKWCADFCEHCNIDAVSIPVWISIALIASAIVLIIINNKNT